MPVLLLAALLPLMACGTRGDDSAACTRCHATAMLATGAHAAHLRDGAIRGGVSCSECHVVPRDEAHAGEPVAVAFATASGDLAAAAGASPTWSATTRTCAAVYCHGAAVGRGDAPAWTAGAGPLACDACHGDPPTSGGHVQVLPTFCAGCHPDTVAPDGVTILVGRGRHVNGAVESRPFVHTPFNHGAAAQADLRACTPCHGAKLDQHGCNTCHEVTPP